MKRTTKRSLSASTSSCLSVSKRSVLLWENEAKVFPLFSLFFLQTGHGSSWPYLPTFSVRSFFFFLILHRFSFSAFFFRSHCPEANRHRQGYLKLPLFRVLPLLWTWWHSAGQPDVPTRRTRVLVGFNGHGARSRFLLFWFRRLAGAYFFAFSFSLSCSVCGWMLLCFVRRIVFFFWAFSHFLFKSINEKLSFCGDGLMWT